MRLALHPIRAALLSAVVIFAGLSLLLSRPVFADVNDFTITNFHADETLGHTDPQGELQVTEHISVLFTDQNHGLLRALPDTYKGHALKLKINQVTSDSGAPAQYTTYNSNGNTVIKIGNPTQTVTGAQEYTIAYTIDNVITFYNDHDELYWDINGDQWSQPLTNVSATIHLPAGLQQIVAPVCYAGMAHSTAHDCTIASSNQTVLVGTTGSLGPQETLTAVLGFQKGYFSPPTIWDTIRDKAKTIAEYTALPLIVGIVCLVAWWRFGRDPKGRGTIIPEYQPPDNLRPIEVGTLVDFKVDNRDITATIIDLAIRKYLKIIETKQKHVLWKDGLQYSLQLVNPDYSQLNGYERELMAALFSTQQAGELVDISVLKNKFYTTADSLRKAVERNLTSQGYFRTNPLNTSKKWGSVGAVLFVLCWILPRTLGPALVVSFVLSGIFIWLTSKTIASRTVKGVAAKEQTEGLKLYLQTAEADRLKQLQGPNAAYAANYQEPTKTIDLFEKLLPYAIVLGVEQAWAKQFQSIYTSAPDWYAGNWTTFNALYLTSSLNAGMTAAVNTAFSAPGSSSGSGFGGGGFAGGGGGGGGGGGW